MLYVFPNGDSIDTSIVLGVFRTVDDGTHKVVVTCPGSETLTTKDFYFKVGSEEEAMEQGRLLTEQVLLRQNPETFEGLPENSTWFKWGKNHRNEPPATMLDEPPAK